MILSELNYNKKVYVIGYKDGVDINKLPFWKFYSVTTEDNGEEVIGVFHNYVSYGKGKSILIKSQCEVSSVKVDDRPVKFGGSQMIKTLDGYSFRLKYEDGLMLIPLRLPTDHEIEKLVHVDMTSQMSWNPSDEKQHDDWSPVSEISCN